MGNSQSIRVESFIQTASDPAACASALTTYYLSLGPKDRDDMAIALIMRLTVSLVGRIPA